VRERRIQPGPGRNRPGRGETAGPVPGHRAAGPGHPGALHPAAGLARPDSLVALTVRYVIEGSPGRTHLPGWLSPRGRHTPKRSPKLATPLEAGDRETVTVIPVPEVATPGGCGNRESAYRTPMPGPGVVATVLRMGDTTSTDWRPLIRPCLLHFPQGRGDHAREPTGGADPSLPALTTQPPAVVPHSFNVRTWRPTQANRPRTGGRRITRWYRNWWRRRVDAWTFSQLGIPLRRRRTTAFRRIG